MLITQTLLIPRYWLICELLTFETHSQVIRTCSTISGIHCNFNRVQTIISRLFPKKIKFTYWYEKSSDFFPDIVWLSMRFRFHLHECILYLEIKKLHSHPVSCQSPSMCEWQLSIVEAWRYTRYPMIIRAHPLRTWLGYLYKLLRSV